MTDDDSILPPDLDLLRRLVIRLRAPDGCAWDREQTLASLRPALLEEAHELAAAIDEVIETEAVDEADAARGGLREELGDLLFQAVFIGRLAEEDGRFTLAEAIEGIHRKMVDRHPHVFGDTADPTLDADAVTRAWETRKAASRGGSLLDGLPRTLPALTAALRLTQKAAGVGFDWPDAASVAAKVREELAEVEEAALDKDPDGDTSHGDRSEEAVAEELGDLLFAVANLARHHRVDPEAALAAANRKFRRRFAAIEELLRPAGGVAAVDLDRMEEAWRTVKARERGERES